MKDMKKMKKIVSMLLAMVMMFALAATALAADGQITINKGVTLGLFKVADLAVVNGGSSVYTLTSDFAKTQIVFEGMNASRSNEAAKELEAIVNEKKLQGLQCVTNEKGLASFKKLEPGMYLVIQCENGASVPAYTKMDPYLVSVPLGQREEEQRSWLYEVSTLPKTEIGVVPLDCEIYIKKNVFKGDERTTVDDTFYAGIFTLDQEEYVLEQVIELKQNDTVTALLPGKDGQEEGEVTYWIFETDQEGSRIDKTEFAYEISGEGSVSLNRENPSGEIEITNTVKEDSGDLDSSSSGSGSSGSKGGSGSSNVKTGDETPVELLVVICLGAMILLGALAGKAIRKIR